LLLYFSYIIFYFMIFYVKIFYTPVGLVSSFRIFMHCIDIVYTPCWLKEWL